MLQYPATAANVNDQFYFTINDLFGGTNKVFVDVVVNPFVTGQQVALSPANPNSVTCFGRPGYTYLLQRSTNLFAGVGWVNIRTNTIAASGCTNVLDHFSDLGLPPTQAFYRVGWKPSY